jgi:long-chain fatty acid transport protein
MPDVRRFPRTPLVSSALLAAFATSTAALATTEPPNALDARIAGMAAGGVAIQHNGAALYHNPALLGAIGTFSGTLSVAPFFLKQSSPIRGPNTSMDSATQVAPVALIGAGYRLNEQFVIGLGAQSTAGFGAKYEDVAPGTDAKMVAYFLEVSPGVAYSPHEKISIGLAYRISYASLSTDLTQPTPAGPVRAEQDLSGTNFAGVHVGALFRATPDLDIGLSYKNKVNVSLSGDVTAFGAKQDSESELATPHRFALGAGQKLLDGKLLLAVDAKYLLYKNSSKELPVTVNGVEQPPQILEWKNVFGFNVGAEYLVTERVPVRLGYEFTQSATPKERPLFFATPPGALHGIHVGAGLRLDNLDLDLGALYAFGKSDVGASDIATGHPAFPGTYEMKTRAVALSATYHR